MSEAVVVDANVAVKWVLQENGSDAARALAQTPMEAPDLLLVECSSVLSKKVRLGDITPAQARALFETLRAAPVAWAPTNPLLPWALDLSLALRHPVYDCVYLALASQRGLPLVTADERLAAVARRRLKDVRVRLLADLE